MSDPIPTPALTEPGEADLRALRAVAEAAQVEWQVGRWRTWEGEPHCHFEPGRMPYVGTDDEHGSILLTDRWGRGTDRATPSPVADHAAAFDPDTALVLLDEIDRLRTAALAGSPAPADPMESALAFGRFFDAVHAPTPAADAARARGEVVSPAPAEATERLERWPGMELAVWLDGWCDHAGPPTPDCCAWRQAAATVRRLAHLAAAGPAPAAPEDAERGLGQTLRRLRAEREWTLAQVAEAADLSLPYVSNLEHDRGNPTLAALDALADAFGTTAADLLRRREPSRPRFGGILPVDPLAARPSSSPVDPGTGERQSMSVTTHRPPGGALHYGAAESCPNHVCQSLRPAPPVGAPEAPRSHDWGDDGEGIACARCGMGAMDPEASNSCLVGVPTSANRTDVCADSAEHGPHFWNRDESLGSWMSGAWFCPGGGAPEGRDEPEVLAEGRLAGGCPCPACRSLTIRREERP